MADQWVLNLERGTTSQNHLGRLVRLDQATVKGVVDRLARAGFVERGPCEVDRRKTNISLTPKGEDLAKRNIPVAEQVASETMSGLTEDERARLLALLGKL
ncbi:MarR family transcriptional regulator [Roseivivax marinus]|uniref:MarR family winged helix-turn-helix transcriptional regulator n=1 Tax=Roseivivax marinus TaxID=1379903 RepID=UPI0009DD53C4